MSKDQQRIFETVFQTSIYSGIVGAAADYDDGNDDDYDEVMLLSSL